MALLMILPFASATHLNDFNKKDSEFDLKAIALSGPFGPRNPIENIQAFRFGEGSVIRSQPYQFYRFSSNRKYYYN